MKKRLLATFLVITVFLTIFTSSFCTYAEDTTHTNSEHTIKYVKSDENYDYGSDTVYIIRDKESGEIIPFAIGPLDGYSYAYLPEDRDFTVEKVTYNTPFNDLGVKYQYESYIHEMSSRGVMVGFEDGGFKPEKELTRAEMATVFTRLFNVQKDDSASCFEDIGDNHWAREYVMSLVNKGVFVKDTLFNPDSLITREQLVAMTYRMLKDMGYVSHSKADMNFSKYKDMDVVSDYAKEAYMALTCEGYHLLVELVDHDFMDTADDELFYHPKKSVTRVECCEFLYQFIRMFFYKNAPAIMRPDAPKIDIPILDGSTSTYVITENIYRSYYRNHDNLPSFPKSHSKTVTSYKRLIDGEVEMIFVPDAGEDVLKYANEKNVKLRFIPIANEALIFFTATGNSADNITTKQLYDIYVNNSISNWKELGGEDTYLAAYCRNRDSGSHAQMEQFILDGKEINDNISKERTSVMMSSILTDVDDYNKQNPGKYAIGYSLYYYYMLNSSILGPVDLKFMSINGIAPDEETIADGTYPYTTHYYAVIRDGEDNPRVDSFARLMQGEYGRMIAAQSGLGVITQQ